MMQLQNPSSTPLKGFRAAAFAGDTWEIPCWSDFSSDFAFQNNKIHVAGGSSVWVQNGDTISPIAAVSKINITNAQATVTLVNTNGQSTLSPITLQVNATSEGNPIAGSYRANEVMLYNGAALTGTPLKGFRRTAFAAANWEIPCWSDFSDDFVFQDSKIHVSDNNFNNTQFENRDNQLWIKLMPININGNINIAKVLNLFAGQAQVQTGGANCRITYNRQLWTDWEHFSNVVFNFLLDFNDGSSGQVRWFGPNGSGSVFPEGVSVSEFNDTSVNFVSKGKTFDLDQKLRFQLICAGATLGEYKEQW
jgi:hypothetical protein